MELTPHGLWHPLHAHPILTGYGGILVGHCRVEPRIYPGTMMCRAVSSANEDSALLVDLLDPLGPGLIELGRREIEVGLQGLGLGIVATGGVMALALADRIEEGRVIPFAFIEQVLELGPDDHVVAQL